MTGSISSLGSFFSSGVNNASAVQFSNDQWLMDLMGSSEKTSASGNAFGDPYSLDLSDSALSALGGSGASPTDILSALTYSNFSIPSTGPIDTSTPSFAEEALADGGPLPAFLAEVDVKINLNTTQRAALQNIATEFKDAQDTPQTVMSIAAALQQAGIPETI